MPRQKRKRSSVDTPLSAPRRKNPRYNLRNRIETTASESDSNSSVIFVGSCSPTPRKATITKRNLRKRITQAKVNARSRNTTASRYHRRHHPLVDAASQTDESFKCPSCGVKDAGDVEEKSIETIYQNTDFSENDAASAKTKCDETEHSYEDPTDPDVEDQVAVEKEPKDDDIPEPSTEANDQEPVSSPVTTPREENEALEEDPPLQDESNDGAENRTTSAAVEQLQQLDSPYQEHLQSPLEGPSISEPYLSPCGNFPIDAFRSPAAFSSQMEFGCRLDDMPVSPIVPDDMCSGDGIHNDPLQVEVVDLRDSNLEEFLQVGSSNDSDDEPMI